MEIKSISKNIKWKNCRSIRRFAIIAHLKVSKIQCSQIVIYLFTGYHKFLKNLNWMEKAQVIKAYRARKAAEEDGQAGGDGQAGEDVKTVLMRLWKHDQKQFPLFWNWFKNEDPKTYFGDFELKEVVNRSSYVVVV